MTINHLALEIVKMLLEKICAKGTCANAWCKEMLVEQLLLPPLFERRKRRDT